METQTAFTPREQIEAWLRANDAQFLFEFVPFSQSRNAKEKQTSLNWKVTLSKGARVILDRIDYSAGQGHCPAYKWPRDYTSPSCKRDAIAAECEKGFTVKLMVPTAGYAQVSRVKGPAIMRDPCDVIYSLSSETDALNYSAFEPWAQEFGYDPDSRSAEATYRACLATALALRNGFGEAALETLRQACQGF